MNGWTAIVPLKLSADRKSRLSATLSLEQRIYLSDRMARHVFTVLRAISGIETILLVAPRAMPDAPVRHILDGGRGLNTELDAVAADVGRRILVIHGDLPLVSADDITALIDAADQAGCAIAPDRHGQGTNALALATLPHGFAFAFGPDSFALHRQRLGDANVVVHRDGLALDVDTQADLDWVRAQQPTANS